MEVGFSTHAMFFRALTPTQGLRTALARALVTQPEFLILDQPLGLLDDRASHEFWDDLRRIHVEAEVTTMVLTDDPAEALALADRLAVIDLGRIIQVGPPRELYNRPVDVFVARLLGPTNLLQGQVESDRIDPRGEVVVRTPLGRLIGQSHPTLPAQGSSVTISVRPETLSLGPTIPVGWNRFPATIERMVFCGELRQIHVRGPGDWPVIVSTLQNQSQTLREGQSLRSQSRPNTSWSCRASSRSVQITEDDWIGLPSKPGPVLRRPAGSQLSAIESANANPTRQCGRRRRHARASHRAVKRTKADDRQL